MTLRMMSRKSNMQTRLGDISIFGQESNATTRRLAMMNLATRGIAADFGPVVAISMVHSFCNCWL